MIKIDGNNLTIEDIVSVARQGTKVEIAPEAYPGVSAAHTKVREVVPYQAGDAWWGPEIEKIHRIIINGELIQKVNKSIDVDMQI